MNRDELLRVAAAASTGRTAAQAIAVAEELIGYADKWHGPSVHGIKVRPKRVRVKPEPVAWRFAFPSGGQTITTSPDSYGPGTYSQRTPLYEPEV